MSLLSVHEINCRDERGGTSERTRTAAWRTHKLHRSCCSEQRRGRDTTVRRSMTFNSGITGRPQQQRPMPQTARNLDGAVAVAMLSRNQSSAAAFKPLVMSRRREAQQPSQRSLVTDFAPLPPLTATSNRSLRNTNLTRSQSQFVPGERWVRAPVLFPPQPRPAAQRPPPVRRPQQRLPALPQHPRNYQQQQQPWYDLSTTPSCSSSTASSSEIDLRAVAGAQHRGHEVSRNFSSAGDSKYAFVSPRPQQRPPRLLSYSSSFCSSMGNVAKERQRLASAGAFQGSALPDSTPFQRRKKSVKDCIVS